MNGADQSVSVPKEELLDAALAVLARSGTPRPQDVAREADVSKALLFHHFGSIEGLHDAMTERVLRETQQGLDALASEYPNPRERIEALVRALLAEPPESPASARHVMRFWLEGERGALRDGLLADFVKKTLKEMRSNADAPRVASLILARWHGTTVAYANGTGVDFDGEAERALREIDAML